MKKMFAMLLTAMLLVACTACGGETKDLLSEIQDQGYIELTTEPYFAPYEFVDPSQTGDAQFQGMDIEIAKAIADKLEVELRIVPLYYTAVLAGVADAKYDMAISAIAYSPSRAEAMNLSDGYYFNDVGYGFLTRAEDAEKYNSVESLKDAVVITQSGSVQEGIYNEQVKDLGVKEFKLVANMTDGFLAVAEGKADVCICDTGSAQLYADANGGLAIPDYRFTVDPKLNGVVVALPLNGSESLMEVVNECIAQLNEEGKILQWYQEYSEYAGTLGLQ